MAFLLQFTVFEGHQESQACLRREFKAFLPAFHMCPFLCSSVHLSISNHHVFFGNGVFDKFTAISFSKANNFGLQNSEGKVLGEIGG